MKHHSNKKTSPEEFTRPAIIEVGDLMIQIQRFADIRRKVRKGYYDRPEVLADVATEIRKRLK